MHILENITEESGGNRHMGEVNLPGFVSGRLQEVVDEEATKSMRVVSGCGRGLHAGLSTGGFQL